MIITINISTKFQIFFKGFKNADKFSIYADCKDFGFIQKVS